MHKVVLAPKLDFLYKYTTLITIAYTMLFLSQAANSHFGCHRALWKFGCLGLVRHFNWITLYWLLSLGWVPFFFMLGWRGRACTGSWSGLLLLALAVSLSLDSSSSHLFWDSLTPHDFEQLLSLPLSQACVQQGVYITRPWEGFFPSGATSNILFTLGYITSAFLSFLVSVMSLNFLESCL